MDSLFIPRVFKNVEASQIRKVFEYYGIVKSIDFVEKEDKEGNEYNSVYIYFERWHNTPEVSDFQSMLSPTQGSRVYYSKKYYWVVLKNKIQKKNPYDRKVRVDLTDINSKTEEHQEPLDEEYDEELEEIQDILDADDAQNDANLVSIDANYVQILEQENSRIRYENACLNDALDNLQKEYEAEHEKNSSIENAYTSQQANIEKMMNEIEYLQNTIKMYQEHLNSKDIALSMVMPSPPILQRNTNY